MQTLSTKPTVVIYLDTKRALKKKGKLFSTGTITETIYPLRARATFQTISEGVKKWVQKLFTLDHVCTLEDYSAVKKGRVRTPRQTAIREAIVEAEQKALTILKAHEIVTAEDFTNLFNVAGNLKTVSSIFEIKIAELESNEQASSAKFYRNAMVAIAGYSPDVRFPEVTVPWLNKLEAHLALTCNATTIGMHMIHFRTIFNMAIKMKIVAKSAYPFGAGAYEIKPGESNGVALDLLQKNKLERYKTDNPAVRYGVDMWLFSFYAYGVNFIDIFSMQYKHIKGNTIIKKREKTSRGTNPLLNIPISPAMQKVIDTHGNTTDTSAEAFVFPLFTKAMKNKERRAELDKKMGKINDALGIAIPAIGMIERVTCYDARHSFACCSREMGEPIEKISMWLGHKTITMTQNYLKNFPEKVNREHSLKLVGSTEEVPAPKMKASKGKANGKAKGKKRAA